MKVGASQYHPGLTVRWRGKGEWLLLWCARDRRVLAIVAGAAPSGYAAIIRAGRLVSLVDEPHARRCDAKRAAEVLVGQWWREKCEREARAADYKARVLAAFRGENHGTGTVDVVARAIAGRVTAAQDAMRSRIDSVSPATAAEEDLRGLLGVHGVEARSGE